MKPKNRKVCEWETVGIRLYLSAIKTTCGCILPKEYNFKSFTYCPYCGKEIKVKEARC